MVMKGKHSNVFLFGRFAIKRFHKGFEMNAVKEFDALKRLRKYKLAPHPYFLWGRTLVMSRVDGKPIKDMTKHEVVSLAPEFLKALYILDVLKIKKEESHRPSKHFFKTKDGIQLIDFERSHPGTGNVTQFLAFLERYFKGITKLGKQYKQDEDLDKILKFIASNGP